MALIPISRDTLRSMKAEEDEMKRMAEVNRVLSIIYREVVESAKSKDDTSYNYTIPVRGVVKATHQMLYDEFFMKNMDEILVRLRSLFPECTVEQKTLSRGNDGKMYEISKMDSTLLPFVNHNYDQSFIVVNWS